jgi:iron complex outermembrane recepter protein
MRGVKRSTWASARACLVAVLLLPASALAAQNVADLIDLSLEQLSNMEITSVSRRAERLSDAAASIYVITNEDIRRSGATTLPQALRLAPNLQSARTGAGTYAISARGFNNSLGNKLLVLIDGRTVYTPLFSGVFWDAQDVVLEDVDRIEVISGPGATLWGANAVNGVINVITRRAQETRGTLVSLGGGNREARGAARYGGQTASGAYYRVYGKRTVLQDTERANGASLLDGWDHGQAGFRTDWGTRENGATVQGDAYHAYSNLKPGGSLGISGVNLLGRWKRELDDGSHLRVQGYYDGTERNDPASFHERLDIADLEFQHALRPRGAHTLLWGGGYRYAWDRVENTALLAFLPPDRNLRWANLFAQDEVEIGPSVRATLGAKVETNVYTGAEFLPTARLAWKRTSHDLVWTALSRAVRAPARIDRDFFFPGRAPFAIRGGPQFQSEVSNVIELGYRAQPVSAFSYSVTAFRHLHERLRSGQPAPGGGFVVDNKIEGTTTGLEAWGSYQVTNRWRLMGGLLKLRQDLHLKSGSLDPVGPRALGNDPDHQWMVRSLLDLTGQHEFDVMIRHVSALPDPLVPAYTAVDARLGWRPSRAVEWSLSFENMFDPGHAEFGAVTTRPEFERAVFLRVIWRQ